MRSFPQDNEPEENKNISTQVKKSVPKRIDLQIADVVGRKAGTREHMMPLKYLMKNDAIEKAAQPKPKQDASSQWKMSVFHFD